MKPCLLLIAALSSLWGQDVRADQKPLKVFVLVGQSNMQGHAHVRTFEHIGMDPRTAPLLNDLQQADGTPRVFDDIWISYLSSGGEKHGRLTAGFGADENKIGPELTFGISMHKQLQEPILIIKTAWGGKSLHTDFRPPSAGPYEFNTSQIEQLKKQGKDVAEVKAERAKRTGHYYRLTVDHVRKVLSDIPSVYPGYDPAQGYTLEGIVWFQGWNDMVDRGTYPRRDQPAGYDQYSEVLAHLIRDLWKDLEAPELPFVIGVLGVGGPVEKYLPQQQRYKSIHENFRQAMAAPASLPEFEGTIASVRTEQYWDMELVALRARESKLKQQVKKLQADGQLNREQARATERKLRAEEFTERELMTLEKGVSNFEFHYLGCAKIMAQIGQGFAQAMTGLMKESDR